MSEDPVLSVRDLRVALAGRGRASRPVDGVGFEVDRGEAVGVVGESGSGKSLTLRAIAGLLPRTGRVAGGSVRFAGTELTRLSASELRRHRGTGIGMVFQEPLTALNPTMRIGDQVAEGPRRRLGLSRRAARRAALDLLEMVGIPDPAVRARQYPHEFSGGMRQRVVLAIALACAPRLLLCDEPTTALDVTVQEQILGLLDERVRASGVGMVLVTHDLPVVARTCSRVVVLYAGRVVETGPTEEVFAAPRHPYTLALLRATPSLDVPVGRLASLPGTPPDPAAPPPGCRFAPRCAFATPECSRRDPPSRDAGRGRSVACLHPSAVERELAARPLVGGPG